MTTVIYHKNCSDGFCAAWLFKHRFPDATFIPCQYGDPVPLMRPNDDLYIVDFSFDRETLVKLNETHKLVVLDHHKTAQANCEGLDFCIFDMSKCGARLALEWITEDTCVKFDSETQSLVNYIEDRDLWKWELRYSKEVSAAIRSYPFDFNIWREFNISALAKQGHAIERYRRRLIDTHIEHAKLIKLDGYEVLASCCTVQDIYSEVAGALAENRPFGVVYCDDTEQGIRTYSLRSKGEGIDVSKIAKSFGGGGHKHAAGFTFPL